MANINQKPNVSSKRGHNGFDMSMRRLFSAPCGMLLPVYSDFAIAGDKYKFTPNAFIRTEAIETAAFTQFKCHFDAFFVPFRLMYQFWNEFYNCVYDAHTDFVDDSDSTTLNFKLPNIVLDSVIDIENNSALSSVSQTSSIVRLNLDEFGVPKAWNLRRLYDLFGYGNLTKQTTNTAGNIGSRNIFNYLAYHKIFYSHFNKGDWFPSRPSLYNIDSLHGKSINAGQTAIFSTIHYRPWRTDYFNNIYPSPTFSTAFSNYLRNSAFSPISDVRKAVNPEDSTPTPNFLYSSVNNASGQPYLLGSDDQFNAADLRSVFALDRLMRVTALSGTHYDDQTFAHLGVKLPAGLSNEAYRVGSSSFDLNINEVVATSTTTADAVGSVIGDIAGKGFGSNANPDTFDFTCPESGVFMCLFSIEPIVDYSSQCIDKLNTLSDTFDFYHPELDDIGMQPLTTSLLSGISNNPVFNGWQYRYSEFKQKYNIVNEGFYETDKEIWQTNFQTSAAANGYNIIDRFNRFYISPQYSNTIFALPFPRFQDLTVNGYTRPASYDNSGNNGTNWQNKFNQPRNIYSGDNFLVQADFKCYKSSIMSVHSLPRIW